MIKVIAPPQLPLGLCAQLSAPKAFLHSVGFHPLRTDQFLPSMILRPSFYENSLLRRNGFASGKHRIKKQIASFSRSHSFEVSAKYHAAVSRDEKVD